MCVLSICSVNWNTASAPRLCEWTVRRSRHTFEAVKRRHALQQRLLIVLQPQGLHTAAVQRQQVADRNAGRIITAQPLQPIGILQRLQSLARPCSHEHDRSCSNRDSCSCSQQGVPSVVGASHVLKFESGTFHAKVLRSSMHRSLADEALYVDARATPLRCLVKCLSADHDWSTAGRINECSQGLQSRNQFLTTELTGDTASNPQQPCLNRRCIVHP